MGNLLHAAVQGPRLPYAGPTILYGLKGDCRGWRRWHLEADCTAFPAAQREYWAITGIEDEEPELMKGPKSLKKKLTIWTLIKTIDE